jgi:hypothetical protein
MIFHLCQTTTARNFGGRNTLTLNTFEYCGNSSLLQRLQYFGMRLLSSMTYIRMVFWALFETISNFVPALAMNRLLAYLENPTASTVTPYVWVVALLVVPIMNSMFIQQYFVNSIQLTANAKAALVQALYEKTLRVRMVGAPKGGEEVERNRVGRINNLMSSDM